MKRKKAKYIIFTLIVLLVLAAFLPPTRSYLVMRIYSASENAKSVMNENDFKIKMSSDKGWYPFVITFNPTNFGEWSNTGADMSIMYNFASFEDSLKGTDIFNAKSTKHSTFYGAYALSQDEGYFGYINSEINIDEIVLTFVYDYKFLVLNGLGCEYPEFEVADTHITENIEYAGTSGWTKIDATIKTNAMLHNYKENHTSYIQYGKPWQNVSEDFPVIDMYGRLYIKAFEEYNSTVIIYVMSPFIDTIEQCDDDILSQTVIKES